MIGLLLSLALVALSVQSCAMSSESASSKSAPSAPALSMTAEQRAFMREAGLLLGYLAEIQGVVSACDSRLLRNPIYESSLNAWQANNESLLSEIKALKKRLVEGPIPVFVGAALARVEHEFRDKSEKKLWALSLKGAKEQCDSTEARLVANEVHQQIRAQLDVVTKAEQALINVSSK